VILHKFAYIQYVRSLSHYVSHISIFLTKFTT